MHPMRKWRRSWRWCWPVALGLVLAMAGAGPAAAMPALAPVVAGIATFLATPVGQIVLGVGLQVAGNLIARAGKRPIADPGMRTQVTVGATRPLSFAAGRIGLAGQRVYAGSWGNVDGTPNAYGVDVLKLSDYPIDGYEHPVVFGQPCTVDWDDPNPPAQGHPVLEYRDDSGRDHLWVRFHDGSQTAADAYLVDKFGGDAERPWKSTAIGRGRAYAVYTWRVNPKLFPRWPEILSVVRGIRCYDRRKDSTAGGSGPHRRADPATWEWSANPIAIADTAVFTGLVHGGRWLWGLQGMSAARLPASAWIAALNECDVDIDRKEGGSEKQFSVGMEIMVDQEPADVLDELAKSCNGRFAESGGIYKPLVGAPGAAVWAITDDDIVVSAERLFEPFPPLRGVHNGAVATYVEPGEAWGPKATEEYVDADAAAEDGERLTADLSYPFVVSGTQAQRLVQAAVRDGRRFRRHAVGLPPIAALIECVDVIAWTSATYGYDNKKFIVDLKDDLGDGDQRAVLIELDPADHDWDPENDERPVPVGPLTPVRPVQIVTGWQAFGDTFDRDGVPVRPTIRVDGPGDLDDTALLVIKVRDAGDLSAVFEAAIRYGPPGPPGSTRSYKLQGRFNPAYDYEVQIDVEPDRGARDTAPTGWLAVTTPDVRIDFPDLAETIREWHRWMGPGFATAKADVLALTDLVALQDLHNFADKQELRREIASVFNTSRASYTEAILAATGPGSALVLRLEELEAAVEEADFDAIVTALSALTARVTTAENTLTLVGADVTAINAALNGYLGTNAVASAFSSHDVRITANEGGITTHAQKLEDLFVSLGGNTASVRFRAVAEAGPSGYSARYAIEAATSAGGWRSASLFIDVPASAGVPTRVAVAAQQFVVWAGGTASAVFDADGQLLPGRLKAGSIEADKIVDNALTGNSVRFAGSTTINNGTGSAWTDVTDDTGAVMQRTITVTDNAWVLVMFWAQVFHTFNHAEIYTRVVRDGNEIESGLHTKVYVNDTSAYMSAVFCVIDTPTAGNRIYKAQWKPNTNRTVTMHHRGLLVAQFRK